MRRWWKEQECSKTIPFRGGILKSHFLACTSIYEQEYSAYRAAFTKSSTFIVTIDDLMDLPGVDPLDILKFNEAVQRCSHSLASIFYVNLMNVQLASLMCEFNLPNLCLTFNRWDPSGCDDVPKFKAILSSFLATVEDMGTEASRTQGRDVLPYYKRVVSALLIFCKTCLLTD